MIRGLAARLPRREYLAAGLALAGVVLGLLLHQVGREQEGDALLAVVTAALLVPLTWEVLRSVLRGDVGVDAIALVAMATALGMREFLAGAVVALMLSGGNALEAAAGRRARRDLEGLVSRAPRVAQLVTPDGIHEVPVEAVRPGDALLVRSGEVVPVDGRVEGDAALLDESALTGEPLPVAHEAGDPVRSGVANAGDAFTLRATRPASESAYAALVRLVSAAETQRAPFVRLADRYAAILLPVTLAVAGLAWAISGESIRFLAVMVVATPCPLILAAPIAYISGVSRAARRGVILKGGAVIERLGDTRTVLLDKTGTLTSGAPRVERVEVLGDLPETDVLRLAASVEQHSAHVLAGALVAAARRAGIDLTVPTEVRQEHGQGIAGIVGGRRVTVGSAMWLRANGIDPDGLVTAATDGDGVDHGGVLVGVDGHAVALLHVTDPVRSDAPEMIRRLREAGVAHIAMVTGDRRAVADQVAMDVGIERVWAECSPEDKLAVVREVRATPGAAPVVMVGDGINDAPALAMADVGIAMGTAGATIASETADAVVMVDRIDRVAEAIRVSRYASGIARQSVKAGMTLSFVAMGFAAFGFISPVAGALIQEAIDVAVILNALRALRA